MVRIGEWNELKVLKKVEFGVYLDDEHGGEILLPKRDVPPGCEVGAAVKVFVHYDSEDRLVATTRKPKIEVGRYALLKVVAVEEIGAFLDWGLPKDLFLPFAEQSRKLRVGQETIVFAYLDKSARISATMRLERHADKGVPPYKEGQAVGLMMFGKTDLGYKALIEGKHVGVIYANEVFQPLHYGQELTGYIKKVREDGKIDLRLQEKTGHQAADDVADRILERLRENEGYLEINDKTSPEFIYEMFGVSKKKYKIALGGLYKKRLIRVEDDGIYLV